MLPKCVLPLSKQAGKKHKQILISKDSALGTKSSKMIKQQNAESLRIDEIIRFDEHVCLKKHALCSFFQVWHQIKKSHGKT